MAAPSNDPVTPGRPATPRWVWGLALAAILVTLLIVAVLLIGGGEHGPGRHTGSAGGPTSGAAVVAFGMLTRSRLT